MAHLVDGSRLERRRRARNVALLQRPLICQEDPGRNPAVVPSTLEISGADVSIAMASSNLGTLNPMLKHFCFEIRGHLGGGEAEARSIRGTGALRS